MTLINCVKLYIQINLTTPNDVIRVARPSFIKVGTHSIFAFLDVNGLAIDASALDNDNPAFAAFKAFNLEMIKA